MLLLYMSVTKVVTHCRCKTNQFASLPITFKDPEIPCSKANSHCIAAPSNESITKDLVCDSVYNTDIASKLLDKLGPLDESGNLQQYCHSITYSIPFEIDDGTTHRQLLFVSLKRAYAVLGMDNEELLGYFAYQEADVTPIGYTFAKAISTKFEQSNTQLTKGHVVTTTLDRVYLHSFQFTNGKLQNSLSFVTMNTGDTILDLEAFYDTKGAVKTPWATVLIRNKDNNHHVRLINLEKLTNGAPDPQHVIEWALDNLDVTNSFVRLESVEHATYDRDVAQPTTIGCFPAKETRVLISVYTKKKIWILQFDAGLEPTSSKIGVYHSLDMSGNTVSDHLYYSIEKEEATEITSLSIFGECFGDFSKPAQKLWLTIGLFSTASTIEVVELPEFADAPFICYDRQADLWNKPTSKRGTDCQQVKSVTCLQDISTHYVDEDGKCQPRRSKSPTTNLVTKASDIKVRLMTHSDETVDESSLDRSYIHQIFVANGRTISLFAFQESVCNSSDSVFDHYTDILGADSVLNLEVSHNSQHLFTSVMKNEWQIQSNERFTEICRQLEYGDDTTKKYLEKFKSSCDSQKPSSLNIYDFIKYYSQCNLGWYCPRFGNARTVDSAASSYQTVDAGKHVIRPMKVYDCEPGFYCPELSNAVRKECPIGFKCPNSNMRTPIKCDTKSTYDVACHVTGLTTEAPCPDGHICMDPVTPIPVPPGFFVNVEDRSKFHVCQNGSFCPLAAQNQSSILCPEGTYCSSPTVITPQVCEVQTVILPSTANGQLSSTNQTLYCPSGTGFKQVCAAGYYCPTPLESVACEDGFFCPAGAIDPKPCPAGYYCPTPKAALICPKGYFCREGSVNAIKCQFLVRCKQGTVKPAYTFTAILINGIVLVLVLLVFVIIKVVNLYNRRQKNKIKNDKHKKTMMQRLGIGGLEKKVKSLTGYTLDDSILEDEQQGLDHSLLLPKKNYTMDFELKDLSFTKKRNDKVLFEGVTAKIKHGRITVVMGREQEARLALLHVLSGRDHYGWVNGSLSINGTQESDMTKYKSIVSLVPRNMVMPPELKVHELLRFTAHSRLPKHTAYSEISRKVNNIIRVLGMEKFKYDVIGRPNKNGLNQVQRVFVNLAVEMIAEPHVLFIEADLETLPLLKSVQMMKCLQKIAKSGVTVVVIADRPRYDLFKMADDVILMGKTGVVYNGPVNPCLQYFSELDFKIEPHYNPPDFFLDIIEGNVEKPGDPNFNPEKLLHYWGLKSQETNKPWYINRVFKNQETSTTEPSEMDEYVDQGIHILDPESVLKDSIAQGEKKRRNIGFIGQYFMFSLRALLQLARHLKGVMTDFILAFSMGSLLGGLYYNMEFLAPMSKTLQEQCPAFIKDQCTLPRMDGVAPMSLLTIAGLGIVAMQGSLKTFGQEKKLYKREAQNGINKLSYFLGKLTADLPGLFVFPLIFLSIWYVLVSPRANLLVFYGIFLLNYLVWRSYGYLLSLTFQRLHCELLGVMTILVGSLLAGLSPTWAVMRQKWYTLFFSGLSPVRWAFELLYVVELKKYKRDGVDVDSALNYYGFSYKRIWLNILLLFIYIGVFLVSAFIIMVIKDPGAQSRVFVALRIRWRKTKRTISQIRANRRRKNNSYGLLQDDGSESAAFDFEESENKTEIQQFALPDDDDTAHLSSDEEDNGSYQPPVFK
jgi:ABC-type multidrug transport system ATPase subunit